MDKALETAYGAQIAPLADGFDVRHVEAFMRSEHGTLDHLSPGAFAREVGVAKVCIMQGGAELAERLARSYGL
jgi:hypothetical protein